MCEVIIIDYDTYYHKSKTPDSEDSCNELVSYLKDKSNLYLWTCNDDKKLYEFINICRKKDVYFDSINDNILNIKGNENKKKIISELNKLSLTDWSFMFGFAVII